VVCLEVKLLTNPLKKKGHMLQLLTIILIISIILLYPFLLVNQITLDLYFILPLIYLRLLIKFYMDNYL
jgi:hypothetical protein